MNLRVQVKVGHVFIPSRSGIGVSAFNKTSMLACTIIVAGPPEETLYEKFISMYFRFLSRYTAMVGKVALSTSFWLTHRQLFKWDRP